MNAIDRTIATLQTCARALELLDIKAKRQHRSICKVRLLGSDLKDAGIDESEWTYWPLTLDDVYEYAQACLVYS